MNMHTPEPWKNGKREDGTIWLSIGNPVTGPHYQFDIYCSDADAALITAAPAMLAALKSVWKLIEDGQLVRNTSDDPNPDWAMRQIPFVRAVAEMAVAIEKTEGRA